MECRYGGVRRNCIKRLAGRDFAHPPRRVGETLHPNDNHMLTIDDTILTDRSSK